MFEVQFKKESDYLDLKPYAKDSYDTTKVLLLEDSFKSDIPEGCLVNVLGGGDKLNISFDGKDFILDNIDPALRSFLEFNVPWGNSIALRKIKKIYFLAKHMDVSFDGKYKKSFYRLNKNSTVKDLEMFYHNFKFNRKFWNLEDYKDLYCRDLFGDVQTKSEEVFSYPLNIVAFNELKDSKGRSCVNVNSFYKDEEYDFKIYSCSRTTVDLLKSQEKINSLIKNGKFVCFLPKEMKIKSIETFSPSKEVKKQFKVPVEFFRICYYEYLLRTEF